MAAESIEVPPGDLIASRHLAAEVICLAEYRMVYMNLIVPGGLGDR